MRRDLPTSANSQWPYYWAVGQGGAGECCPRRQRAAWLCLAPANAPPPPTLPPAPPLAGLRTLGTVIPFLSRAISQSVPSLKSQPHCLTPPRRSPRYVVNTGKVRPAATTNARSVDRKGEAKRNWKRVTVRQTKFLTWICCRDSARYFDFLLTRTMCR